MKQKAWKDAEALRFFSHLPIKPRVMAGLSKVFISDDEKLLATKEPEIEGGLEVC